MTSHGFSLCLAGGRLANTGWTDEARAAALAVRREKAAARKGLKPEGGKSPSASAGHDGASGRKPAVVSVEAAKAQARKDAVKRWWAKQRVLMFEQQREQAGDAFVGNWYPEGSDGAREDPHFGVSTPEAPYGYEEGTTRPRVEPLYDGQGQPIVPRPRDDYFPTWQPFRGMGQDKGPDRDAEWLAKQEKAKQEWGPFGRKKRFMRRHPGATEADWEAYDKARFEKWKKANPR